MTGNWHGPQGRKSRHPGRAGCIAAARGKVTLHTQEYTLKDINQAIDDLYGGRLNGRGILVP